MTTNRTNRTLKKRETFIQALSEGFSVTTACMKASITRSRAYAWRNDDAEFAAEWDAAVDQGTDLLEDEARRRAYVGVDKPVFQGKELVGHIREYSDTLLIFTLKARRPEKFRENHKVDLTGDVTHRLDGAKEALDRKLAGLAALVAAPGVSGEPD
jgi:hypothetical protein